MSEPIEVSLVIPVYNGARTIGPLVERICQLFAGRRFEVVLVNDGSQDDSERVCGMLADRRPGVVRLVQLSRNFGEHHAVLAGLNYARGDYVCVLDDDGQNPPEEAVRLVDALQRNGWDVAYGRARRKRHGLLRNLGSWLNDRAAGCLLGKPADAYVSSFRAMSRFVADEVTRYRGPFPHVDALICRVTDRIGEVVVEHRARRHGRSGYTLRKLVGLWLNLVLGNCLVPMRCCLWVGAALLAGGAGLGALALERAAAAGGGGGWALGAAVVLAAGAQLTGLGVVGEYVGRLFLEASGTPQYVVRYVKFRGRRITPRLEEKQLAARAS